MREIVLPGGKLIVSEPLHPVPDGPKTSMYNWSKDWPPLLRMLTNILHCPVDICLTSTEVMVKSAEVCCIPTEDERKAQTMAAITMPATASMTTDSVSIAPALLRLIPLKALMRSYMRTDVT